VFGELVFQLADPDGLTVNLSLGVGQVGLERGPGDQRPVVGTVAAGAIGAIPISLTGSTGPVLIWVRALSMTGMRTGDRSRARDYRRIPHPSPRGRLLMLSQRPLSMFGPWTSTRIQPSPP
jgi:hypothetical protein